MRIAIVPLIRVIEPSAASWCKRRHATGYNPAESFVTALPLSAILSYRGAVAQLGRAPESHSGGRRFEPVQLHQNPKQKSEGRKQKCFLLSARFEIRVQLGHDGIDCRSVSYSDVPRVRPSELLWLASAIEERDDRCGRELLIVSRGDHE